MAVMTATEQMERADFHAQMATHYARMVPEPNTRRQQVQMWTRMSMHNVRNADLLLGTETAPKAHAPSWMDGWTFAVSEEYDAATCERYAGLTADLAETFRKEREVWTDSAATWQTYMHRAQYMTVKYMERAEQLGGGGQS
jgi:hypothetical protein